MYLLYIGKAATCHEWSEEIPITLFHLRFEEY
jgi:hypothetical protein